MEVIETPELLLLLKVPPLIFVAFADAKLTMLPELEFAFVSIIAPDATSDWSIRAGKIFQ